MAILTDPIGPGGAAAMARVYWSADDPSTTIGEVLALALGACLSAQLDNPDDSWTDLADVLGIEPETADRYFRALTTATRAALTAVRVCANPAHDHDHDWASDGYDIPQGCCSDCREPMFYDEGAGTYFHTSHGLSCFLAGGSEGATTPCQWVGGLG